jgi:hypothetical protein
MLGPASLTNAPQALAQPEVGVWTFKQRPHERSQVESGSANEDRQPAARFYVTNRSRGSPGVLTCCEVFLGFRYVYKVVRDAALLGQGYFCRREVKAAVNLD